MSYKHFKNRRYVTQILQEKAMIHQDSVPDNPYALNQADSDSPRVSNQPNLQNHLQPSHSANNSLSSSSDESYDYMENDSYDSSVKPNENSMHLPPPHTVPQLPKASSIKRGRGRPPKQRVQIQENRDVCQTTLGRTLRSCGKTQNNAMVISSSQQALQNRVVKKNKILNYQAQIKKIILNSRTQQAMDSSDGKSQINHQQSSSPQQPVTKTVAKPVTRPVVIPVVMPARESQTVLPESPKKQRGRPRKYPQITKPIFNSTTVQGLLKQILQSENKQSPNILSSKNTIKQQKQLDNYPELKKSEAIVKINESEEEIKQLAVQKMESISIKSIPDENLGKKQSIQIMEGQITQKRKRKSYEEIKILSQYLQLGPRLRISIKGDEFVIINQVMPQKSHSNADKNISSKPQTKIVILTEKSDEEENENEEEKTTKRVLRSEISEENQKRVRKVIQFRQNQPEQRVNSREEQLSRFIKMALDKYSKKDKQRERDQEEDSIIAGKTMKKKTGKTDPRFAGIQSK